MWTREQLKMNARYLMNRNYWECVTASIIMGLFSASFSMRGMGSNTGEFYSESYGYDERIFDVVYEIPPRLKMLLAMFLAVGMFIGVLFTLALLVLKIFAGNVLIVGGCHFFILNRTEKPKMRELLVYFKGGHYGNIVFIMFLRSLYITLWTLLCFVPGVIKSYEYRMVPYILAENPNMDRHTAFDLSRRMMDGEKWNAFVLDLSFIGWYLLSAVTCGIVGIFYVQPYVEATNTELYAYNKVKAYNQGYIR